MEHCLTEADQTEHDSISSLFIYVCDILYIYLYIYFIYIYIYIYGDVAIGDLVIVGLECQPYLETSYAIIVFALNVICCNIYILIQPCFIHLWWFLQPVLTIYSRH